jgi:hypothetical protein
MVADSKSKDELISDDGDVVNTQVNDCLPTNDKTTTGFGLAYTDAQYIETKLAKILNDICRLPSLCTLWFSNGQERLIHWVTILIQDHLSLSGRIHLDKLVK